MAFNFIARSTAQTSADSKKSVFDTNTTRLSPRSTPNAFGPNKAQLAKLYPSWLKEDSKTLKQLPGIYLGVLGQVQLQPNLNSGCYNVAELQSNINYMNRLTDTERVQQLLTASHLPDETLAAIWAHVNQTHPGKLTNRELCLALALIALFQRLDKEKNSSFTTIKQKNLDPFSFVKQEKKPPIPTLYPNGHEHASTNESTFDCHMTQARKDCAVLVDLQDSNSASNEHTPVESRRSEVPSQSVQTADIQCLSGPKGSNPSSGQLRDLNQRNLEILSRSINLLDFDSESFEVKFDKLLGVWLKFLSSMKRLFKESYDILNVKYGRASALEALRSPRGVKFSKSLTLCYPLAHNVKFKIDELTNLFRECQKSPCEASYSFLMKDSYIEQIDSLMISVNEYWAVLINLFHESGQTKFIEFIMDGLNYDRSTITSTSIEELSTELSIRCHGETKKCSICHTNFYLLKVDSEAKADLSDDDLDTLLSCDLISDDHEYFYHAKCANFWLNHVDRDGLPFRKTVDPFQNAILIPLASN